MLAAGMGRNADPVMSRMLRRAIGIVGYAPVLLQQTMNQPVYRLYRDSHANTS